MGKICHECEDPSWTGQDPIVAPVLPSGEGGGTSDFNQMQNRPKYGGVEMSGSTDIPNIEGLIPTTASSENQLADKAFVNSSVATNTAYFVGTFNTIEELEAVENPSNNDYGFVISTDSAGNTVYNRYKFNSDTNAWVFEYALNNSSFTAAQWAAIQSGITSEGVNKLEALALIESVGEGLNLDANGELSFDKSLIGKARVLTTADYNWPTSNPNSVALWLLDAGTYTVADSSVYVRTSSDPSGTRLQEGALAMVSAANSETNRKSIILSWPNTNLVKMFVISLSTGGMVGVADSLITKVRNTLTSTETGDALSAAQGKVLKDMIDALPTGGATQLGSDIDFWTLESGVYIAGANNRITRSTSAAEGDLYIVLSDNVYWHTYSFPIDNGIVMLADTVSSSSGTEQTGMNDLAYGAKATINNLTSTSNVQPLSAAQGKVLNDKIGGDLSNLTTTDKTSLIAAINEIAGQSVGGATELTSADYNWPTDNPASVALWLLEPGLYSWGENVRVYPQSDRVLSTPGVTWTWESNSGFTQILTLCNNNNNYLTKVNSTTGSVASSVYPINLAVTVVQTTGTSTTDVMSQNAVTSMVYADPATREKIQIGVGANSSIGGDAIGYHATTGNGRQIAFGSYANVTSPASEGIAIGRYALVDANGRYSIALGCGSIANEQGQLDISCSRLGYTTSGYNSSAYRLLTGLYDPQSDHDAANKEYVDNLAITYAALNGTAAPTTATAGTYVGQLYLDTTNDKMYYLASIDSTADPVEYNWAEIGGGPNVVQTTGTSTTDVMSQNAVTSMIYAIPASQLRVKIGNNATTGGLKANAIGDSAHASGSNSLAVGAETNAIGSASVAVGWKSFASAQGEFSIGGSALGTGGYNNSNYRLLTNVYDPQSAHDAANKEYVDNLAITYAALNGTSAPTTATAGTYVGQLYLDTTNDKMYYLSAIDTTIPEYTWAEIGGGPNVVQTTGTSTADVMSQNAVTHTLFDGVSSGLTSHIAIGTHAATQGSKTVASSSVSIGSGARADGEYGIAIGGAGTNDAYATAGASGIAIGGYNPTASGAGSIAIGIYGATASGKGSIALGYASSATAQGQMDIGSTSVNYGYNNSNYRLLTGLYDPQNAHDAANKQYVDPTTDSTAPTTATVGRLGQIYIDTTTGTAYMCVKADTTTPEYTWKQITA